MLRKRKSNKSIVSITNNTDEENPLLEGLNLIEADSIITNTDCVVITPNWVNNKREKEKSAIVVGQQKEILCKL